MRLCIKLYLNPEHPIDFLLMDSTKIPFWLKAIWVEFLVIYDQHSPERGS